MWQFGSVKISVVSAGVSVLEASEHQRKNTESGTDTPENRKRRTPLDGCAKWINAEHHECIGTIQKRCQSSHRPYQSRMRTIDKDMVCSVWKH